ncbi:MAG: hypothetical protein QG549_89 [Patescibacteria group bacterium]|nr:hypothetical protein [Patescibacteria group bacterium]
MFWRKWGKAKVNRERILALDLLRGTFLVEIIAAHIAWHPSIYTFISGGNQLPASAAEGFFAISGILVGYLYGPRVLKDTKKVFIKIWKRAGLLWFLATFFTIFYTAWAVSTPDSQTYLTIYDREAWRFLLNTFTLRYSFGWAEFLNRYAMFMLFAPFAVWLIAKGRAWIVALGSFLIWFFLRETAFFLPFSAWQIVFFFGIILGFYLPHIEALFKSLSKDRQRVVFRGVLMSGLATYIFSVTLFLIIPMVLSWYAPAMQLHDQAISYFDKTHLAPARIAVGILWFVTLYMLFRYYEQAISKKTYGVLEVFGRQSLFVYSFHAVVLFIIDLYFIPPAGTTIVRNTIVTTAVLGIIYVAAYYRGHVTDYGKKLLRNRSTTQIP